LGSMNDRRGVLRVAASEGGKGRGVTFNMTRLARVGPASSGKTQGGEKLSWKERKEKGNGNSDMIPDVKARGGERLSRPGAGSSRRGRKKREKRTQMKIRGEGRGGVSAVHCRCRGARRRWVIEEKNRGEGGCYGKENEAPDCLVG